MFGQLSANNSKNANANKSVIANANANILKDELAAMRNNNFDSNVAISSYFGDAESTNVPSSMEWRRPIGTAERFYLGDDESDVDEADGEVYGFGSSPDSWDDDANSVVRMKSTAVATDSGHRIHSAARHSSSSTVTDDGTPPIIVDCSGSSSGSGDEMLLDDDEHRGGHSTCFVMSSEEEDEGEEDVGHYEKTVKEVKKKLSTTSLGFVLDEDSGLGGSAPNSANEEEAEAAHGDRPTQLVPLRMRTAAAAAAAKSPKKSPENRARKSAKKLQFYDYYKLADDHLGAGAYACVRTCISRATGVEYAVKLVDKREPGHTRSRIFREVEIFKLCKSHPNIVQLVEWFEDDIFFYMVFEKMHGGPLLDHIQRKVCFTEQEASQVTRDIANALKHLHDRGIAHRDVKPENILCTERDHVSPVKLCDLDLASKPAAHLHHHTGGKHHHQKVAGSKYSPQYSPQQMKAAHHTHQRSANFGDSAPYTVSAPRNLPTVASEPDLASPVGSAEFMAPEVIDAFVGESLRYDKRCDMWSLGVIVYIMLCGYPPFYGECERNNCGWDQGEACSDCQESLFHRIQIGEFNFPDEEWDNISAEAKDLICHLLVRNVRQRYTADDVLAHPWVAEGAPKTPLQTPSNLFRNDSARDMHQMNQVFQVYQHLNQPKF